MLNHRVLSWVLAGVLAGGGALINQWESPTSPGAPNGVARVEPANDAALAQVAGLQSLGGAATGAWEEKCCRSGGQCSPDHPQIWNLANCWQGDGQFGGCGTIEGWPCLSWVGTPLRNKRCVEPPPGSIVVPQCRETSGHRCQKYRVGICSTIIIWPLPPRLACVCDVDSEAEETWANGRVLCAQGSTPCSGIVPAQQTAIN